MNVNQTVLDAIELLANSKVEKANYNTTIQAQIISCEDASIGKYRCRYQDAIIYAYSNNIDTTYTNGSYVNILVPGNDMSKDKTILSSTTRSGVSYISQLDNQAVYDINGTNCINVNDIDKFYLNTLNRDYKYTIYQYGEPSDISLDDLALAYYIRRSSSIKVAATFKTSIAPERQTRGHYGITYNLRFLDNTSNQEVIRSYTINEDNMKDNPYRLAYGTEQSQYFKIDGQNFIRIESIEIFNKEFPGANGVITDRRLETGDIEITNLKFFGTSKLSESELNGLSISLSVPEGLIFKDDSTTADYKTITAKVRIKGKEVAIDKNFSFYWGRENNQVMANNRYYNKHLGRGWQCLNQSNIIDADPTVPNDPNAIIEWVPAGNIYKMSFTAATASDNKIKVVVVYNGNTASKQVNIKNLCAETPQLTIESSNGTKFYYDIGHPTLTCKVNGTQPQNYHYYWAYVSDNQVLEELPKTTSENTAYTAAVTALTNLQNEIIAGTKFENAQKENLTTLQNNVKAFNSIQRVEGNKIYNVQINDITDSRTFKCTVVNENGILLGTPSITLENTLSGEDLYSLVINNGTQVFQYNENGVAPNSKSLDSPQEILPLSFTIYDNLGQPIQEDILENINNCRIKWEFPKTDTMLVDSQENGLDFDEDENYRYYDDKPTLFYNISQRYYIQKQRNQIKLTVRYKGLSLSAETNFTFAKQGEPGTNGTEYIVKLVPNTTMSVPPLAPMITKAGNKYILNYGLGTSAAETELSINNSYKFFKAQLWHSGELVWEGNSMTDTAQDNLTQPSSVIWSVLKNKYNNTYSDASAFEIVNANNGQIKYTGDHLDSNLSTPLANIIKCSIDWEGKTYYGTIPIVTAWTSNEKYRVKLKDYTGFRYVMYTSDGVLPQYDDTSPFEFICEEFIDNIWEDISLVSGIHAISYEPSVIGNYLSKDGAAINSLLLEILPNNGYEKNQCIIRPKSKYDGLCVNNAVCCIYKQNNVIIGKINVPIHFLLNKYGLSHINEWDGNSVQVDQEGGFILSPQVGAGRKENDHSFTGVLMGQVRSPDKSEPQSGLFGYNSGARTFFLNSQNGSAIFGKADNGQIIIDPIAQKAMIYSHNFWKSTNYGQDGLPIDYTSSGQAGAGLLINLTAPEIRFGNGKFSVNPQGILHAEEANISGVITATTLNLGNNATIPIEKIDGLQNELSGYIKENGVVGGPLPLWQEDAIYAINDIIRDNGKIYKCILAHTSAQSNKPPNATYWEEDSSLTTFVVSSNGLLTASNAIIYGTIYASAGKIGGLDLLNNGIKSSNNAFSLNADGTGHIGGFSFEDYNPNPDLTTTPPQSYGGLTYGSLVEIRPDKLYVSSTPDLYKNSFYAITNHGSYIGIRNDQTSTSSSTQGIYLGYVPPTLDYSNSTPWSFSSHKWGMFCDQSSTIWVNGNLDVMVGSDSPGRPSTGNIQLYTPKSSLNLKGSGGATQLTSYLGLSLYVGYNDDQTEHDIEIQDAYGDVRLSTGVMNKSDKYSGHIEFNTQKTKIRISGQSPRLVPTHDTAVVDLGRDTQDGYRFNNVFCLNVDTSSDRKLKDILGQIDFAEDFIMSLQPISFMWKKGDHRRTRMGFIAQDVAKVCKNLNQNLSVVAASYKSNDPDEEVEPYFGEQVDDNLLSWGLSYDQFIAPIIAVLQKQQKRIKELEDIIYEN